MRSYRKCFAPSNISYKSKDAKLAHNAETTSTDLTLIHRWIIVVMTFFQRYVPAGHETDWALAPLSILYKGDNFCFAFLLITSLLKRGPPYFGNNLFSFTVDPFSEGSKKYLTEIPPMKVNPFFVRYNMQMYLGRRHTYLHVNALFAGIEPGKTLHKTLKNQVQIVY